MSKQEFTGNVPTGSGVTPHDLRVADFRRILKGYDPAQVTDLLHRAGTEIEILLTERDELTERLLSIEGADIENQKQVRDLENLLQTHERRLKQGEQQLREKEEKIQALTLERSNAPDPDESADLAAELAAELTDVQTECQRLATVVKNKDETLLALETKLADTIADRDEAISMLRTELELSQQAQPAANISNIPDMLANALSAVEAVLVITRQFLTDEASAIIKTAELDAATIRKNAETESIRERKEAEATVLITEKRIREYSQFLERQMRDLPALHPKETREE